MRLLLNAAALLALSSCAIMYPDPDPEEKQETFASNPEEYSYRAKKYFLQGEYGRARVQLSKYLEHEPSSWMSQVHLHYCDYYLGLRRLKSGNIKGGRKLISNAEGGLRRLWGGDLAQSTSETAGTARQPWKAAFGIAICQRGLGWADNLQAERQSRALKTLKRDDPRRQDLQRDIIEVRERSSGNYTSSAILLERLVEMKESSPEAIKNLAELRLIQAKDDEAEKHFLHYLRLADATYQKRSKALEEGGEVDQTFKSKQNRQFAKDLLLEKLDANSTKRVDVLVNLGHLNYQKGSYLKAISFLERAKTIQPDRLDILLKMGQCLGENKQYEAAIKHLRDYIERSTGKDTSFNEDIAQAFRLKASYERKLKTSGASGRRP